MGMSEKELAELRAIADAAKKKTKAEKKKREQDARNGRYWDGRRDGHGGRMHL